MNFDNARQQSASDDVIGTEKLVAMCSCFAHRLVVKVIKLVCLSSGALSTERSGVTAFLTQSLADGFLGLPDQLVSPGIGHWDCKRGGGEAGYSYSFG